MGAEQSTVGGPLDTSDAGLDARFATLDKDQSGKLSRAKAEAGIMALYGVEIDDATLNSMFKAADGNQDGAVDLAEFKAIVRAGAATGVATNATSSKVPAPASLVSLDQQSTDVILSGMEEVLDQMPAPAIASGGSLLELKTHLAALGESATATNTKRSSIAGSFRGLLSWRPTGFSTSRSGGGLTERLFRAKRGIKHNDPKLVFEGLHGCSLHAAINQPSLLRESIKYAKDVSAKDADNDRTPLHWAAARGHLRCIQMLIDAGANKEALDANGKTAAQLAESSAQPMASTLILFGPPLPDQRPVHAGLCGLSLHAALNQPTQLTKILESGSEWRMKSGWPVSSALDVNRKDNPVDAPNGDVIDPGDRSPLHWAAARGSHKCVELLLSYGASTGVTDEDGKTPAALALEYNQLTVQTLILNYSGPYITPSSGGHPESAKMLGVKGLQTVPEAEDAVLIA